MIPEIEIKIKNTVGYAEAQNKTLFMVGANVAYDKTKDYYETKIKELESQLSYYKSGYEEYQTDALTFVNILNKYNQILNHD